MDDLFIIPLVHFYSSSLNILFKECCPQFTPFLNRKSILFFFSIFFGFPKRIIANLPAINNRCKRFIWPNNTGQTVSLVVISIENNLNLLKSTVKIKQQSFRGERK